MKSNLAEKMYGCDDNAFGKPRSNLAVFNIRKPSYTFLMKDGTRKFAQFDGNIENAFEKVQIILREYPDIVIWTFGDDRHHVFHKGTQQWIMKERLVNGDFGIPADK